MAWDGPVEIITPGSVNAANDMFTLVALIQDSAPVNTGQLKTDLSARRGDWKLLQTPRVGFRGIIRNSYAGIQDQGGTIPERRPKGSILVDPATGQILKDTVIRGLVPQGDEQRAMGWGGPVGGPHTNFAKVAGSFDLPGQNYVEKGFDRWVKARGGFGGPTIAWVASEESLQRRGLLGLARSIR